MNTSQHATADTDQVAPGAETGRRLRVVDDTDAPPKRRVAWTADQLMSEVFVPPVWAVPGIIAEGVSLLCGPPKVGKSWASLGLALSVASGGEAFGKIPVDGGDVLYLALEDTPRRLQSRMRKILAGQSAPSRLTLTIDCPPMDQGGSEAIDHWLTNHPNARMVVIDVFAKVRGGASPGVAAYDADYAAVGAIKRLADRHAVPIVLVHHVRKMASDDFLAEVSGTNGIAGAADATLVLKRGRGSADGILYVTGRDVDEAQYSLGFAAETGTWHLLDGDATDHQLTETRAAIIAYLRQHPPAGPRAIATATKLNESTVKGACGRMTKDGLLAVDGNGQYRIPAAA